MKLILRPFLLLAVLVAAMAGLVACGGGDEGGGGGGGGTSVSNDTDPGDVLTAAFENTQSIKSGVLSITGKGSFGGQSGEFTLSGPFESQGTGKAPKLDWDLTVDAAGQSVKGKFVNTGTKAFLSCEVSGVPGCDGSTYVVDDATYKQFTDLIAQAQQQQGGGSVTSFKELGIDPATWLKSPENAGESDVDGTETVKVKGDVDVRAFAESLNTAIQKAGSLGATGGNVPEQITDADIKQAEDTIKQLSLEVDAGKDDGALRRMLLNFSAEADGQASDGTFEIKLSDAGEDQEFPEPEGAKPIQELLGGLGGLGALGGAGASGGSAGSSGGSAASQQKLEEYSKCIEDAGSDSAKAQECAAQLG